MFMPKFVVVRIPGHHSDFRRENPIPNIGVGFIAAIAGEEGYQTAVLEGHMWLDMGYLPEALSFPERIPFFVSEIETEAPDVLGISVLSGDLALGIELAKFYKKRYPETFILMGGMGVNGIRNVIARYAGDSLDAIVEGEGEATLREILQELKKGVKRDLSGVKGASVRVNNKWQHNPRRELISNLDSLPLATLENYKYLPPNIHTLLPIERGCPGNCRFCFATETWGNGRYFSPERIIKQGEILLNFQKSWQTFFMSDSNIFASEETGERVLRHILGHFPQAVGGINVRLDQITPRLMQLFSEFPHVSPLIGVESLSSSLLEFLGKTKNSQKYQEQTEQVITGFQKNRLNYCLSLIYHIPGETLADLEKIYQFFQKQDPTKCKLIYLSRLWLEGNTALWHAYNRGEVEIYQASESKTKSLGEQYGDVIFEPFTYLFRNPNISDGEYRLFAARTRDIFRDTPCYYLG
jgi:anaerobic magnesium-protoporphyrin IX monomethyl ester cyclase